MGSAGHSSLRGMRRWGWRSLRAGCAARVATARPLRTGEFSMLPILTSSFTAAHPGQTGYRHAA
ncbi:hypothetical protein CFB39_25055 [Burkholderia sp. AU6039]|nr:hypothetical protein CFB39_25055 [Burkholderia sp. AU6039]